MSESDEPLLDATTGLLPPLLTALEVLGYVARHLHPPELATLVAGLAPFAEPLESGLARFRAVAWPDHLTLFRTQAEAAAEFALRALEGLEACQERSNPLLGAYTALGYSARALEALYPVAQMLGPVSRFFLSEDRREDPVLAARIGGADAAREEVGVMHAGNATGERGGFSLYVPEYYDPGDALPLVVALHGGSGHGRSFLWTWLRDARSRGAILATPTSREDTWSLLGPDQDTANLHAIVEHLCGLWSVDQGRVLLTGMSDGATFSYLSGLRSDSPFTHLAPISGTFHPFLLEVADAERLKDLPVYLVHGALDWMFPVDVARLARDTLTAAGARVHYKEVPDLSHTYPREQNARILDWLLDG